MGSIWGRQDPGGPHVGPVNFAIWGVHLPALITRNFPITELFTRHHKISWTPLVYPVYTERSLLLDSCNIGATFYIQWFAFHDTIDFHNNILNAFTIYRNSLSTKFNFFDISWHYIESSVEIVNQSEVAVGKAVNTSIPTCRIKATSRRYKYKQKNILCKHSGNSYPLAYSGFVSTQ